MAGDLSNVAYTNTAAARYTFNGLQLQRELSKVDYRSNTVIIITAPPTRTPPVVTNFVPAVGASIFPNTALQFDVTDNSGSFATVVVMALFSDGTYEVVHDGTVFSLGYSTASVRTVLPGVGFRFQLLRANGWPASPTVNVVCVDQEGTPSA